MLQNSDYKKYVPIVAFFLVFFLLYLFLTFTYFENWEARYYSKIWNIIKWNALEDTHTYTHTRRI